jgi:hypothetical protein
MPHNANMSVALQEPLAMLPGGVEDIEHGILCQPGQAGNGVDADTFKQDGNGLRGLLGINHDALQRLGFGSWLKIRCL